jgi:hypothetical protein
VRFPKPALEGVEANQGAGDGGKGVVEVEPALVADGEAAKAAQPSEGAFDHRYLTSFRLLSTPRRAMLG